MARKLYPIAFLLLLLMPHMASAQAVTNAPVSNAPMTAETSPGAEQTTTDSSSTASSPGGQSAANSQATIEAEPAGITDWTDVNNWTRPERLSSSLQIMLLLSVISLAPAVLIMTTSFVRIIVVFGLLRQALGTQQMPPSQVITALSLFLTLMIMAPVWKQVYDEAIHPYTQETIGASEAWDRGVTPVRRFMSMQIERTGNADGIWMLLKYMPEQEVAPETYDDVPLEVLIPAYMLSELKTAFLMGFQIYLPFLILDMVIASVLISMGMMMLPPVLISLPFKLLLFVLVDGWHLVVGTLLASFVFYSG